MELQRLLNSISLQLVKINMRTANNILTVKCGLVRWIPIYVGCKVERIAVTICIIPYCNWPTRRCARFRVWVLLLRQLNAQVYLVPAGKVSTDLPSVVGMLSVLFG
jgi:hypothetical protein